MHHLALFIIRQLTRYHTDGHRYAIDDIVVTSKIVIGGRGHAIEQKGKYDLAVCEIHAGATSEKLAMGFYLDGRCSAVYGTHTHVQTADARVNPKGTGYITDLGMTGPLWSVLGVEPEQSIAMFRGDLTEYFRAAGGETALMGAVFDIDQSTGKCRKVTPLFERLGG